MPDDPKMKPINFDNLDEAKQPSKKNSGFSAMDTVRPEKTSDTKTTGDAVPDPQTARSVTEENKLPPAEELEKEEENPEQRKLAGEAPYVTARNTTAFTPEVEGGVVKEDGKNKRKPDTASSARTTSTPTTGTGAGV